MNNYFNEAERELIARALFQVGKRISACERKLNEAGFKAYLPVRDLHKSFMKDERELLDYETYLSERAAESFGSLKFPGYGAEPGDFLRSEYLDGLRSGGEWKQVPLPERLNQLLRTDPEKNWSLWGDVRAAVSAIKEKEALRFERLAAGLSMGDKKDRVAITKLAAKNADVLVAPQPSFAECRPVFSVDVNKEYSIAATLVRSDLALAPVSNIMMDWKIQLVKGQGQVAFKNRYTSYQDHVKIWINEAMPGVNFYGGCSTLEQIALSTTVYAEISKWLSVELSKELS